MGLDVPRRVSLHQRHEVDALNLDDGEIWIVGDLWPDFLFDFCLGRSVGEEEALNLGQSDVRQLLVLALLTHSRVCLGGSSGVATVSGEGADGFVSEIGQRDFGFVLELLGDSIFGAGCSVSSSMAFWLFRMGSTSIALRASGFSC